LLHFSDWVCRLLREAYVVACYSGVLDDCKMS
jgi:hypothetical protein